MGYLFERIVFQFFYFYKENPITFYLVMGFTLLYRCYINYLYQLMLFLFHDSWLEGV